MQEGSHVLDEALSARERRESAPTPNQVGTGQKSERGLGREKKAKQPKPRRSNKRGTNGKMETALADVSAQLRGAEDALRELRFDKRKLKRDQSYSSSPRGRSPGGEPDPRPANQPPAGPPPPAPPPEWREPVDTGPQRFAVIVELMQVPLNFYFRLAGIYLGILFLILVYIAFCGAMLTQLMTIPVDANKDVVDLCQAVNWTAALTQMTSNCYYAYGTRFVVPALRIFNPEPEYWYDHLYFLWSLTSVEGQIWALRYSPFFGYNGTVEACWEALHADMVLCSQLVSHYSEHWDYIAYRRPLVFRIWWWFKAGTLLPSILVVSLLVFRVFQEYRSRLLGSRWVDVKIGKGHGPVDDIDRRSVNAKNTPMSVRPLIHKVHFTEHCINYPLWYTACPRALKWLFVTQHTEVVRCCSELVAELRDPLYIQRCKTLHDYIRILDAVAYKNRHINLPKTAFGDDLFDGSKKVATLVWMWKTERQLPLWARLGEQAPR